MIARFARIVLPLFFVTSASAGGATDITITGAKMDPLPVFASPEDAMPLRKVALTSLPLPLTVKEVKSEFFRVSIGGVDVWVDSMKVRASHKVVARCGLTQPPGTPMAGELGASSDRCSK